MTGNELKSLRIACGMTQSELAKSMHVSHQTISKWEKGLVGISSETESDLYAALGVDKEQRENFESSKNSADLEQIAEILEQLQYEQAKANNLSENRTKTISRAIITAAEIVLLAVLLYFIFTIFYYWKSPEEDQTLTVEISEIAEEEGES